MSELSTHAGQTVLQRLAEFAAFLRSHGFAVGVSQQQAMLESALALGLQRESALAAAWRAVACHRVQEWRQWPGLFEQFFHPERLRGTVKVSGKTRPRRDLRQAVQDLHSAMEAGAASAPQPAGGSASDSTDQVLAQDGPGRAQAMGGASRTDPLDRPESQLWWPQELGSLMRLARQIHRQLPRRRLRRWQHAAAGSRPDMRQLLRQFAAHDGDALMPPWQARRTETPRLFLLVDVSRSMQAHGAFFLRVARAFAREAEAQVYVFHTRLADVSALMHRDSARVQEKINTVTAGFGAGTRIGQCLQDFAASPARRLLGPSSRVWVFSDGFDTDEPEVLRTALQAVRGRGARIDWFYPTRQAPQAQAWRASAHLIDRWWPMASLQDLQHMARGRGPRKETLA